ncbi:sugar ABC transporter permease [Anaerolineaceae bacterium oral taxon 439]|nr:sugar ABC transporter permease [Anaerolineaceae bacterium oral taxon 439]
MITATGKKKSRTDAIKIYLYKNWQFWALIALPVIYLIIFNYIPMGGIILAFKRFSPRKGIFGSDFVGLMYFRQFLGAPSSLRIIRNTLRLGVYSLLVGFPIPILLALAINEVKHQRLKKFVQIVTYAPYFISLVVLVGIMMRIMDLRTGILNHLIVALGGKPVNFFGSKDIFPHLYVWSGVWQISGYASIIYIAALSGVNPELQEAAIIDGASRVQRIWNVDLPAIRPTIVMMLIFNVGQIMNIGFEKAYLMKNSVNQANAEIISTFVYEIGLKNGDFSFSTAVGLFNSVISLLLFVFVNEISKRLTETSVW